MAQELWNERSQTSEAGSPSIEGALKDGRHLYTEWDGTKHWLRLSYGTATAYTVVGLIKGYQKNYAAATFAEAFAFFQGATHDVMNAWLVGAHEYQGAVKPTPKTPTITTDSTFEEVTALLDAGYIIMAQHPTEKLWKAYGVVHYQNKDTQNVTEWTPVTLSAFMRGHIDSELSLHKHTLPLDPITTNTGVDVVRELLDAGAVLIITSEKTGTETLRKEGETYVHVQETREDDDEVQETNIHRRVYPVNMCADAWGYFIAYNRNETITIS